MGHPLGLERPKRKILKNQQLLAPKFSKRGIVTFWTFKPQTMTPFAKNLDPNSEIRLQQKFCVTVVSKFA